MSHLSLRLGSLCCVMAGCLTTLLPGYRATPALSAAPEGEVTSATHPKAQPATRVTPEHEVLAPAQPEPEPVSLPQPAALSTLEAIQRRGTITFLMHHDPTSYFLYRGKERGFEYELAVAFAKELGVKLNVRIPPPGTPLTQWLREGKGDITVGLVTTDGGSAESLHVSIPYLETPLQKITGNEPLPMAIFPSLHFTAQSGTLATEAQNTQWTATVTAPLAKLAQTFYPERFRMVETLSTSAHFVWAVRPEQTELLKVINRYLQRVKRSGLRKILFEKYFVYTKHLRNIARVPEFTLTSKRLSRYDRLIAQHAEKAGFDWRFVAALIFQESRFDPRRISNRGAVGLMQVTRIAAKQVGVKNFRTLEGNIEAGVKYLQFLAQKFSYHQENDRLAFALAGYLLGPGRVVAAQRLAQAKGYDPDRWEKSVEAILPRRFTPGRKAVRYVNAILNRYALYQQYVSRELHTGPEEAPLQTAQASPALADE